MDEFKKALDFCPVCSVKVCPKGCIHKGPLLAQKKIDHLTKENERLKKELMLEKAVVEKVTDLRPSRYSGEYEANDVNLVMGSARTRITERKEL